MIFEIKDNDSNNISFKYISHIEKGTKKGIEQAFYKIGKDLKHTARRLILDEIKTGRLYKYNIGGKRIVHISSAPNQSPASVSGKLVNSIDTNINGGSSMEFGAGNSTLDYAKYLELGTIKMAKRPYLIRSINLNERNNYVSLQDKIEKELSK